MTKKLGIAIYDTPGKFSNALADKFRAAGHSVLFEGVLKRETARNDADIWVIKWTFDEAKGAFLSEHRPKLGIVSLSRGIGHIDIEAVKHFGLKLDNCPDFGSNAVTEHTLAVSLWGLYGDMAVPSISEKAKVIFLIGTNTSEQHPLISRRIIQAVKKGAKLIVADPRNIDLAEYAEIHLRHKPGTDVALLNAMMNVIYNEGLHDKDFIVNRTENSEELIETIKKYPTERAETITSVPAEDIREAAILFADPFLIIDCGACITPIAIALAALAPNIPVEASKAFV